MAAWTLDQEIDANYDFFRRHLNEIFAREAGRIAVLRDCAFFGFFDSVTEADAKARVSFPDGIYSLQPVVQEPVDLGFYSHAGG
ncbi:MAG: hypothetical protein JSS55_06655 [Proteobacteria bacterium]|nr:hypothetical protein [Pseudomonadota bacterium]